MAQGARKLYCTAPETSENVVKYLLRSGMQIETHLLRHYAQDHNELVFGKMLKERRSARRDPSSRRAAPEGHVAKPESLSRASLVTRPWDGGQ